MVKSTSNFRGQIYEIIGNLLLPLTLCTRNERLETKGPVALSSFSISCQLIISWQARAYLLTIPSMATLAFELYFSLGLLLLPFYLNAYIFGFKLSFYQVTSHNRTIVRILSVLVLYAKKPFEGKEFRRSKDIRFIGEVTWQFGIFQRKAQSHGNNIAKGQPKIPHRRKRQTRTQ